MHNNDLREILRFHFQQTRAVERSSRAHVILDNDAKRSILLLLLQVQQLQLLTGQD